jgi:hypothetical protein
MIHPLFTHFHRGLRSTGVLEYWGTGEGQLLSSVVLPRVHIVRSLIVNIMIKCTFYIGLFSDQKDKHSKIKFVVSMGQCKNSTSKRMRCKKVPHRFTVEKLISK